MLMAYCQPWLFLVLVRSGLGQTGVLMERVSTGMLIQRVLLSFVYSNMLNVRSNVEFFFWKHDHLIQFPL